MISLGFNNRPGLTPWLRAGAIALLVLAIASCRVRRSLGSKQNDGALPHEVINSPANVALVPPALPGPGEAPNEAEGRNVAAAAVLVLGFGEVDFTRVRQAQRESEALLAGTQKQAEPWAALHAPLSDIARRRWARKDEAERSVGLVIFEQGRVALNRHSNGDVLGAALTALGYPPATTSGRENSLNYDWAPLRGPVVSLVRARSGAMAISWQHAAAPAELQLAHALRANGALVISCDCADTTSLEPAASELAAHFDDPNRFGVRARAIAEQLQAENEDPIDYAVVALTNHGVTIESSDALVYGTAGSATVHGTTDVLSRALDEEELANSALSADAGPPETHSTAARDAAAEAAPTPPKPRRAPAPSTAVPRPTGAARRVTSAAPEASVATEAASPATPVRPAATTTPSRERATTARLDTPPRDAKAAPTASATQKPASPSPLSTGNARQPQP